VKAIRATIRVPGDPSIAITFLNFTPGTLWGNLVDTGLVARIDARHNRVAAPVTITKQAGVINSSGPFGLASWHGRLWTTDTARRAIAEIDPTTNRVATEIPVGVPAADLSVAGDSLWLTAADDSVVRVDLRTRKVVARLRHFGQPYNILATSKAVWVTAHNTAQVVHIDPASNRIVSRMRVGTDPQSLAVGAGSLWVANGFGHALTRIDIATGRVLATITLDTHGNRPEPYWGAYKTVIFAGGAIWAIARDNSALVRIDPATNRITSSLTLAMAPDSTPLTPTTLVAGGGSLWVGADPRYLFRIDPTAMR
jgi:streptogramin lyase